MNTLSLAPEVIEMATGLRLGQGDPVQLIIEECWRKVESYLPKDREIHSIEELEKIVCEKLRVEMREIWSDQDLENLIKERERQMDGAFNYLRFGLNDGTFGTLMQKKGLDSGDAPSYISVIDCRGEKHHRRFFTRWHEIAHLLTLYKPFDGPFNRSPSFRDPTERLMDLIASRLGFHESLFSPFLEAEIDSTGRLSFQGVQRVRDNFSAHASFEATLYACASKHHFPTLVLEIGLGYKKSEKEILLRRDSKAETGQLPKPKIRVLNMVSNAAAQQIGFRAHKNMRVPESSVLFELFETNDKPDFHSSVSVENLGDWKTSDGSTLRARQVLIEGIKVRGKVFALVVPMDYVSSFHAA